MLLGAMGGTEHLGLDAWQEGRPVLRVCQKDSIP